MWIQFLIEDTSTRILIDHIMDKLKNQYPNKEVLYNAKSFTGIGHLSTNGNILERKGSNLLNNLPLYLKGFDKSLRKMDHSAIVIVMDNDLRDQKKFRSQLEKMAEDLCIYTDYVFCIAVKEIEAWLLGDENAIQTAYPRAKKQFIRDYVQDGLCDTWQTLANVVYPGGLKELKKKAKSSYSEIGRAKCEWADRIGNCLELDGNNSPSFNRFINELKLRIVEEKVSV